MGKSGGGGARAVSTSVAERATTPRGTGAVGGRGSKKAAAAKASSGPHALTAAERARAGLPKERQPGEELVVRREGIGYNADPFAKLSAETLQHLYGDHQLGAALSVYSLSKLKEDVLPSVLAAHPGTRPTDARSQAAVVSYITRTLTHGRYSADFAKTTKATTTRARASGSGKKAPAASGEKKAGVRATGTATARAPRPAAEERPALVPLPGAEHVRIDPTAALSTRTLVRLYGESQLSNALSRYSISKLRDLSSREGLSASGHTASALAESITRAVTSGRYGAATTSSTGRRRPR